jgi:valyl-tRNA synthetase
MPAWVPGTDHASIATEAKVAKLKAEGINKTTVRRVLPHAWDWTDKMERLYSNLKN